VEVKRWKVVKACDRARFGLLKKSMEMRIRKSKERLMI